MKLKVIMLETTNESELILCAADNNIHLLKHYGSVFESEAYGKDKYIQFYLIDESAEIKEGDWYIDDINQVRQSVTDDVEYWKVRQDYNKIIASTKDLVIDVSTYGESVVSPIYLSELSQESIKLLVDYYNQNGKMPEFVEVETGGTHEEFMNYWAKQGFSYDESFGWFESRNTGNRPNTSELQDKFKSIIKLNSQNQVDITIPEEKEFNHNLLNNMQYYMEYCQSNGYVTPKKWLLKHKHYKDFKEEKMYSRKEVVTLIMKCCEECDSEGGLRWDEVNDFINKNL